LPPLEGYAWKIGIARIELVNGLFEKIGRLYYVYYVLVGLLGYIMYVLDSGDNYMKG
jgi:uncharacterized membrane protein YuzA (DUF378 family)